MVDRPTATLPAGAELNTVVTPSLEDRRRALYTGRLNPEVQGLYSLALFDTQSREIVSQDKLDPARQRPNAEYFFRVPPKTHEMTEPFATSIVATQNGGKFIESQGSILKAVRLTGTTGLRPNPTRRPATTIPVFGNTVDQFIGELETLSFQQPAVPADEATGYDDIIFLRNIFREYSDRKENDANASRTIMLWRNAKDQDFWVVEPKEFKLQQDSGSPLTYKYSITLTTLSRFTTRIQFPVDPLAEVLSAQQFFSRLQEYNQSLKRAFLIITTAINRLEGLGVFAQTALLSPLINLIRGIGQVKNTANNFGARIKSNAAVLRNNLQDAISTLENSFNVDTQDPLLREQYRLLVLVARIESEPSFQDTLVQAGVNGSIRVSAYNKSGISSNNTRRPPQTAGSSTFLGNEPTAGSVGQDVVHVGDDIRAVAGRLLGDRGRWKVLVVLNDLKTPYIASTSAPGVLAPGDPVLYPSPSTRGVQASFVGGSNASTLETEDDGQGIYGPVQQVYGRDLRLSSVPASIAGGVDLTDLDIGQNGDLSSIAGVPNVDQGLRIKFSTNQSELPVHPNFGAKFPIGSKATNIAFNDFRIQTEATIYSDSRVKDIKDLRFTTFHDVLVANAKIVLLDAADTLDTSIALRRL